MNANMYNKVNLEIVEALRHIVGEGNVLVGAEEMEPFAHDEAVGRRDKDLSGAGRRRDGAGPLGD